MKFKILNLLLLLNLVFLMSCDTTQIEDLSFFEDDSTQQIEELTFTGEVQSYDDFFVAKLLSSENLRTTLTIRGNGRENLNLTSEYTTFSLPNDDILMEISMWDNDVNNGYFTRDTITPERGVATQLETWIPISGNIKMLVSNELPNLDGTGSGIYDISLQLEDVIFENDNGEQRIVTNLVIEDATVGLSLG